MREAGRIRPVEPEEATPIAIATSAEGFVIEEVEMDRFMRYLDRKSVV